MVLMVFGSCPKMRKGDKIMNFKVFKCEKFTDLIIKDGNNNKIIQIENREKDEFIRFFNILEEILKDRDIKNRFEKEGIELKIKECTKNEKTKLEH